MWHEPRSGWRGGGGDDKLDKGRREAVRHEAVPGFSVLGETQKSLSTLDDGGQPHQYRKDGREAPLWEQYSVNKLFVCAGPFSC